MNRNSLVGVVGMTLVAAGCAVTVNAPVVENGTPASAPLAPGGYSGMAWMGGDRYLVVHDTKIHRDHPRIGTLTVGGEDGVRYRAFTIDDWRDADGRSSDLESVCALPDRGDEYLAAESGTWEGNFGRLFHLHLNADQAEVIHVERIPEIADNDPDTWGDNFEGLACASRTDGSVLVILGERGGTPFHPQGSLRWATYDSESHVFDWSNEGLAGIAVSAPGAWVAPEAKRDIADLYLDPDGVLWSVASEDAGDDGPFRSGVWAVGRVDPDAEIPITLFDDPPIGWWLDGLKVESLAAPPGHLPFAEASVGTEDENLGGVWRPLYPTAAQPMLTEFARRYAAAWSGGDPQALAAFYTTDGSLTVNDSEPAIGRDAVASKAHGFMTAFPDMVVRMRVIEGNDGGAVFRWHWTGTNTGPDGNGRAVDLTGYEEWTFAEDGLIAASQGHYDQAEYERQMNAD